MQLLRFGTTALAVYVPGCGNRSVKLANRE